MEKDILSLKKNPFNCADTINSLECKQCVDFKTHKLIVLKQHCQTGHAEVAWQEKLYECESCTFKTFSKYLFLRHKLFNLCLKKVKVKTEATVSEKSGQLRLTESPAKDTTNLFKCEFCSFRTQEERTLSDHIKSRHQSEDDSTTTYDWKKSKETSKSTRNSRNHTIHKPTKKSKFKCSNCSYETNFTSNLKKHVLFKHTDSDSIVWFSCELCSHKTKSKYQLEQHVVEIHKQEKSFKCKDCSYRTARKTSLKLHILREHTDTNQIDWFHCEDCSYKAITKNELHQHMARKHDEGKLIKCENCSYKTPNRSDLKRHMLRKHTDPNHIDWFHCEDCSYQASTKDGLQKHIVSKHDEGKRIKCESCSYTTSNKSNLKRHVLTKHNGTNQIT